MSTNHTDDAAFALELRKLPYDKRWNLLKPKLGSLFYTTEVEQICRLVEDRWGFVAIPRQYKYRFKLWGWKKSIPEKVKQQVCINALKRAAQGKETIALYHGQLIPPQRLHRTLKPTAAAAAPSQASTVLKFTLPTEQYEILGGYLPFGNSLLVNWRMPYGSRPTDPTLVWNHGSPAASSQTPSSVEIRSPIATNVDSPDSSARFQSEASLTSVVWQQRSKMLLQGRLHDLLRTLSPSEQMTLSTWLYQFWFFGFVTAQAWGRSPRLWINESLDFENHSLAIAISTSNSPNGSLTPRTRSEVTKVPMPPQQCRWTIHVSPNAMVDEGDEYEEDGPAMTDQLDEESFPRHLHETLQSNGFSNIPEAQLPIPVPEVARQITRHTSDMALESVAFAIMARNIDLLHQTLANLDTQHVDVAPIYPLHMASAYLDGGNTCCLVFDVLCNRISGAVVTKERLVNEYGHTVLDSLLLTILRSHTTVNMKDVDATLGDSATMPGQEVDICGRWSADSPCFRTFVATGKTILPASWKHKFCNTSIQAVLHSTSILLADFPTMMHMSSGLFKHQCFGCGQRLQLKPLHALVMTAFCLATAGTHEEDLFGVVAYYLALVAEGISPLDRCPISPSQLLGIGSDTACTHEQMTPYKMATAIGTKIQQSGLRKDVHTGWNVFTTILRIAEEARSTARAVRDGLCNEDKYSMAELQNLAYNVWTDDYAEDSESWSGNSMIQQRKFPKDCTGGWCVHFYNGNEPYFGDSPTLGHIWAAVQAELTNHRKVSESDGWLSESFSMQDLLESLAYGDSPNVGYIKQSMLKPYCRCGNFSSSYHGVVVREKIFREYSANFDGSAETWARSSFLEVPRPGNFIY